jgi:hypothetical protein
VNDRDRGLIYGTVPEFFEAIVEILSQDSRSPIQDLNSGSVGCGSEF